jgi:hypothetical protein
MRRADHRLGGIGEQHRHAIGGKDAEGDPGNVGDQAVAHRPGRGLPGFFNGDHGVGVLLVEGHQRGGGLIHQFHRESAIAGDVFRRVARAVAAVERGVEPGGDAAVAGEKRMPNARDVVQRGDRDHRLNSNLSGQS